MDTSTTTPTTATPATGSDPRRADDFDALLAAWAAAIVANDADAIGAFMTDEWVLVDPQGGLIAGTSFLDAVRSGHLTHASMTHDVRRVRRHGDVATVTTRSQNTGTFAGAPISADEWTTDVFVRVDGAWLCDLTHLSPATTPGG